MWQSAVPLEFGDCVRRQVRAAAMQQLLAGTAQRSNGALTVVALAIEADVPRNALTQRHTGLGEQFYREVRERGGGPTPDEQRLRARIKTLEATIVAKNDELAQLRADVPALVRVVNQLTAENHELRQAATGGANVVPLFAARKDSGNRSP